MRAPPSKGANTYFTVVVRHPVARLVLQRGHAPCVTPSAYGRSPPAFLLSHAMTQPVVHTRMRAPS